MKFFQIVVLLAAVALVGCKKSPPRDLCAELLQKQAACYGIVASDPRIPAAIAECHEVRDAEGKEDPERLKADDAKAAGMIEMSCTELAGQ
jgi:hypothetical protein